METSAMCDFINVITGRRCRRATLTFPIQIYFVSTVGQPPRDCFCPFFKIATKTILRTGNRNAIISVRLDSVDTVLEDSEQDQRI